MVWIISAITLRDLLVILVALLFVFCCGRLVGRLETQQRVRGWYAFRQFLHRHGQHRLCRDLAVRVVDHFDPGPELLSFLDSQTKELRSIDVTSFGGHPVYRTEVRHG